jgi:hypothetical protein
MAPAIAELSVISPGVACFTARAPSPAAKKLGRRTARAEIVFDRRYDAAAKIGILAGQSIELGAEAFGRSAIGEDCFRDRITVRGSVAATARDLEQLGRYQPLDLAGDIGFDQQSATSQPSRQPMIPGSPCRPARELYRECRPREK